MTHREWFPNVPGSPRTRVFVGSLAGGVRTCVPRSFVVKVTTSSLEFSAWAGVGTWKEREQKVVPASRLERLTSSFCK